MKTSIKGVAPHWYTLESEHGAADPVQFYIRPLDGLDWPAVLMESYNPETGEVGGAGIVKAFKLGVRNWRNIEDADKPGEPLKFSRAAMSALRPGWIIEVGQHILEVSRVREDQEKNSDSPSSSPAS